MGKYRATREGYADALLELGEENPAVVVLDADLSKSTGAAKFAARYPERFFNCGVAEANMMDVAAGLATTGKVCYTGSFSVFATGRAFDQVRNTIAYCGLDVKICPSHGGITVGEDGASHQTNEDVALMRSIPGMRVIVPGDYHEAKAAVKAAAGIPGPMFIRAGRSAFPPLFDESYRFELGKAIVLREGADVTICATGIMTLAAVEAADALKSEGISAEVLHVHTIKPLDGEAVVTSAAKTGRVLTAEEHSIIGGLGSAVAEILAERHPTRMVRVGVRDEFGQSGGVAELLEHYHLTAADITAAARGLCTG